MGSVEELAAADGFLCSVDLRFLAAGTGSASFSSFCTHGSAGGVTRVVDVVASSEKKNVQDSLRHVAPKRVDEFLESRCTRLFE